jgi:addiction module RelB/DinJ family antitoxin
MNNTAVINIKTNPKIKKEAQAVASNLGLSLSAVINAYLHQLVRNKKVEYDMEAHPSPRLIKAIREAEKDYKEGKTFSFDNVNDALKFLRSQ